MLSNINFYDFWVFGSSQITLWIWINCCFYIYMFYHLLYILFYYQFQYCFDIFSQFRRVI